jgi:hypothetical protein
MMRDPGSEYSPQPSLVERRAARLLRRYAAQADQHVEDEVAALARIVRRAVALAIVAGLVSGGLIGGSEVWMRQSLGIGDLEFEEALPYWIAWLAGAALVSAVEICFLYWITLKSIGQVVGLARLDLGETGYPSLLDRGFARVALEFPNPRGTIFGLDPYAYVPRWQLLLWTIAYKAKVGVSSFLLRVFLRRVAARLAVRGLIPLLAGPLYAAWNAFIVFRIMREARIRAYGPLAVDRLLERLPELSVEARRLVVDGVGELTRRAADMHPNHVHLIARLMDRFDMDTQALEVEWATAAGALERLDPPEQRAVLRVMILAAVLGSRTQRGQSALLKEASRACAVSLEKTRFRDLRSALIKGRLSVPDDLDTVIEMDGRGSS